MQSIDSSTLHLKYNLINIKKGANSTGEYYNMKETVFNVYAKYFSIYVYRLIFT